LSAAVSEKCLPTMDLQLAERLNGMPAAARALRQERRSLYHGGLGCRNTLPELDRQAGSFKQAGLLVCI
jgi:hypothetical protein